MLDRLINEIPRFFQYYTILLLLQAMATTLGMAVIGCAMGFAFGFVLVCLRQLTGWVFLPVRIVTIVYVDLFRRVPFLVILYLVLFFIQAVNPNASLLSIAIIGICILSIAYTAEIIRAGFESVPRQQIEAATVMNFNRWQILRSVIIPQAWPVILPPAFAYMVGFIKDTALVSQIGVLELTSAGKILNNRGFSALLVFGTILVLYFVLSYPLSRLGAFAEARLAPPRNR
ncbi:MAG: amino acid ABC transporter permease [Methylobacteriaceae bacterium]|nr:amino acid ABC transporter permease [Methylobacteriaceae bacterium]